MTLDYEASEVIASLAHAYANIGQTSFVLASVGSSTIYGANPRWSRNKDDDSYVDVPIIYRSVNSTAFPRTGYNADNLASWATFQNINLGFPTYIPQDMGSNIPWHQATLDQLRNMSTD